VFGLLTRAVAIASDLSKDPWPPAQDPRRRGALRIKRRLRIPIRRTCPFTSRDGPRRQYQHVRLSALEREITKLRRQFPRRIKKNLCTIAQGKTWDLEIENGVLRRCVPCVLRLSKIQSPESLSSPATATGRVPSPCENTERRSACLARCVPRRAERTWTFLVIVMHAGIELRAGPARRRRCSPVRDSAGGSSSHLPSLPRAVARSLAEPR
jgi:hypothetical protein